MEGQADAAEHQLHLWLAQLDSLALELEGGSAPEGRRPLSGSSDDPPPDRLNSYRFSAINMQDSQDVDLDAILGELSALDSQFEEALQSAKSLEKERLTDTKTRDGRTHSPDNDSAFSDCVSLLSSESASSAGLPSQPNGGIEGQTKADKIKLALQKMKEAAVKKLFVKVFNTDGSAKCLLVDEGMTVGYVTRLLAEKNHIALDPSLALVEQLVELNMERVLEDDEPLVERLMEWSRHSVNRLVFEPRPDERTALFDGSYASLVGVQPHMNARQRADAFEEFFAGSGVPEIEGPLYLKDGKKGWRRHQFTLRASGLYYWPKEKSRNSKDLVCLGPLTTNQVYVGVGWRKKLKAPTEWGFALKHPAVQQPGGKSAKFVRHLCADDREVMLRWVNALRLARSGRQLYANWRAASEAAAEVAAAESTPRQTADTVSDSSSSSGCDVAADTELHGTIKRKPRLPLTATTRQLTEIAIGNIGTRLGSPVAEERVEELPPPPPELLEPPTEEYPEPPPPPPPRHPRHSTIFLQDLARVMSKKWQVAEKCRTEESVPGVPLGFRDPGTDYYAHSRESRASRWVRQHYGTPAPPTYENINDNTPGENDVYCTANQEEIYPPPSQLYSMAKDVYPRPPYTAQQEGAMYPTPSQLYSTAQEAYPKPSQLYSSAQEEIYPKPSQLYSSVKEDIYPKPPYNGGERPVSSTQEEIYPKPSTLYSIIREPQHTYSSPQEEIYPRPSQLCQPQEETFPKPSQLYAQKDAYLRHSQLYGTSNNNEARLSQDMNASHVHQYRPCGVQEYACRRPSDEMLPPPPASVLNRNVRRPPPPPPRAVTTQLTTVPPTS